MNRCASWLLGALALAGCNVFDESLFLQRADAGADATVAPLTLAERCSGEVPLLTRTGDYAFDTSGLADDLSNLANCTGRLLPGNDGFFRVRMTEGELWHFHVRSDRTHNPAIYILPSCDERACTGGLDECGTGRDEHISFRARETRDYLVGLDSPLEGGGAYQLTVVRATCGNNVLEHGESCDDNNRASGDGCDMNCRAELVDGAREREPNDDFSNPNTVIAAPGTTVTVQGKLGGGCDFDQYSLALPAGARVRATMLDINGLECGAASPEFAMSFLQTDGRTAAGTGVATMSNRCPAITDTLPFARVAAAGTYFVRVTTATDLATAVDYKLRFEVVAP